jgi:hypothetical protein
LNTPEGTIYYPGKIVRVIKNLMTLAKQSRRAGEAGVRGRADNNFIITEPVSQLFDEGFGRVDFSHTDGMKPDTFFSRISTIDLTESLAPARPIAMMPNDPIDYDGAISQSNENI